MSSLDKSSVTCECCSINEYLIRALWGAGWLEQRAEEENDGRGQGERKKDCWVRQNTSFPSYLAINLQNFIFF